MQRYQLSQKINRAISVELIILFAVMFCQPVALANNPPARCAGYGDLQSISLTVWEAGLSPWTVSTHNTEPEFDTPDWAVVGSLPDSRPGLAAFVADQDNGDCAAEDKSGALTLNSPQIVIPGGAEVPRISIYHWFDIEFGWDGGNLKISVNGGAFNLIPASAIEFGSYNDTLFPPVQDGSPFNTNPLADEEAFTGTDGGQPTGSWGETHINLLGIAGAGDTVKLRFDFGVDQCGGRIGWYVDEVEFYSCEAELPPSDCGNRVIDPGEQCDDGNDFIDDGCSNICQIEEGWQCTAPNLPTVIPDHSFEAGTPNPSWTEVSSNLFGTPICQASVCGVGGGTGPSDGLFWAWFGGTIQLHESSLSQSVVIPSTEKELTFELEMPTCDSASDYVEILIDDNQELLINGSSPLCGIDAYATRSVDISAYADGGVHEIKFHSETFAVNGNVTNFFIDVVELPGTPSECRRIGTNLTLLKTVNNDDGGTAQASAWTLAASGPSSFSGPGPTVLSGDGFLPGIYNLSESGPTGYNASDWACEGGTQNDADTVTLALDDAVTCTITNDDVAPTIKVLKTIINDNGGSITNRNAFGLRVDGGSVLHNATNSFDVGGHTVSEDGLIGYQAGTWGGDCAADGTITLALGQVATCTITNNDISPTLTVINTVVSDDGGTVTDPNAFGLKVDGGSVLDSETNNFNFGSYTVSQLGLAGYQASVWGGDCAPDGSITLALGDVATCTITNDDISPTLKVVKTIINDNGGVVTNPNAFGLRVDGGSVQHNVVNNFDAGNHSVSEDGLAGYLPGIWGGDCSPGGAITLALDQDATCTITNDDTNDTSLTLVKQVINNSGGAALASEWTLAAVGPTGFSGIGPNVPNGQDFAAGSYDLSESGGPSGYSASAWVCVGGTQVDGDTITLALGEAAICTITNDDIPARLTLVKTIINDDGGNISNENAFSLRIDGNSVLHNAVNIVAAGDHTVSEDGLPEYQPGPWGGACAPDGTITLSLDQDATCTISNDDIPPTLKVIKTIINDNGGTEFNQDAFGLKVDGAAVLHDVANTFTTGIHVVSEDGLPGYLSGNWGGDCDSNGNVNLSVGDTAVCTITNDDISPTITVVKNIINDNGGTVSDPNAFGLRVDNGSVLDSVTNAFDAGNHTVSEVGLGGYQPGTWGGNCNADGTITLALGQDATCTITNDDTDGTTLTLVKRLINDNGGNAEGSDWTLSATGPSGFSGTGPVVASTAGFVAGTYTLAESGGPLSGYTASDWVCVGGTQVNGSTITLAFNDSATCTITNNDISPTLKVIKTVVNDNGGNVTDPDAFGLRVDSLGVLDSVVNNIKAGSHTVSEDGLAGYLAGSWGGDCAANGSITLALDEHKTCTISNNDISPTLTVVNSVNNDNGGLVTDPDAFGLMVDGGSVSDSVPNTVDAGGRSVTQTGLIGYQASAWGGDCAPDGSITLTQGQDAICTISNDDISPTLTVVKTIINNNGGTVTNPNFFGLRVDGNSVLDSAINAFDAGSHNVSEDGLANYEAGIWGGNCAANGDITLVLGQNATCTITNDDADNTNLTLVKEVINDNGGEALASEWTLAAVGPTGFSGIGPNVPNGQDFAAGSYDLSESGGPAGYSASAWVCVGGTQVDGDTITLALGEAAICTITNDDIPARLTLVKTIINDDGGNISNENAFSLRIDGNSVLHNAVNIVAAGDHTVSEDGLPEYQPGPWGGACAPDGTITLSLDQDATCTISNDDIPPTLKVIKTIINDNGGTEFNQDAFGLKVDGAAVLHDVANTFTTGIHVVSEDGLPGYLSGNWGGDCDSNGNVNLSVGDTAVCTITNDDISPTITVVKNIINDNGGTVSDPNAFGLRVDNGSVLDSVTNAFDAGNHTVSEVGLGGYQPGTWGGNCNADGTITLALGQDATCTITNDDTDGTTLTLVKRLINDNGGNAEGSDWTLSATGPSGFSGTGPVVASTAGFVAGTYTLAESGGPLSGYTASDWVCVGGTQVNGSTITLAFNDSATCTITNNDISPTLKVIKTVVNDNGGNVTDPDAFGLRVDSLGVLDSVVNNIKAGSHTVSEDGLAGYLAGSWGGDCAANGSITLALDEHKTCTISNNDISPTLTVVNSVTNNNGGLVTDPDAFGLTVDGGGVTNGAANAFNGGPHSVAAAGQAGYQASSWGGDCAPDGSITLTLGQDATCTISHDDISPTLKIVKTVVNDNGGTITNENAFGLRVDGSSVLHNATNAFDAGGHQVSEDGRPEYDPSVWGGDCAADGTITLALGQSATCSITNDDTDSTSLTLVKDVINDDGGEAAAVEWTLSAAGPKPFGGSGPTVSSGSDFIAGTYVLSESGGPTSGYSASDWVCDGGNQTAGDTIALALGETVTCTITNDDISPTLKVVKTITNDDGGTENNPNAFGLKVDGGPVLHNAVNSFPAGEHMVSEDGLADYAPGDWGGNCASDGSITLALGDQATCTITNDDINSTSLTLVKQVTNNNGGTSFASAWTLEATGTDGFSGNGPSVASGANFTPGSYDLSESGPAGYSASDWVCVGGTQVDGDTITLAPNDIVTCTIINDDISPTLKVVKTIINNNGGTVSNPNAFGLKVNLASVLPDAINSFDAGAYTVSEDGLPGYAAGDWGGDCAIDGTITLAPGDNAVCTITNDDISPTITVQKTIQNDPGDGGTETDPDAFGLMVDGNPVLHNQLNFFDAGNHTVSETPLPGYQPGVWGGDCNSDGTIILALNQNATCTITNDDANTTSLTLVKQVINDNGGNATGADWTLTATDAIGSEPGFSGTGPNVSSGAGFAFGTYDLSESGGPVGGGYSTTGAWVCIGGTQDDADTITLAVNDVVTCTITNDDISPTITVQKTIQNDPGDGGTEADPDAFGLMVDGNPVLHNQLNLIDAGNHTVSETGLPGYQPGVWGGNCGTDGNITLALDQDAICTITNDDTPGTSLTLIKKVINDNGGVASGSQWTLDATDPNGINTGLNDSGPVVSSGAGFAAGTYDLSESGGPVGGYSTTGAWVCVGGTQDDGDTITLADVEAAICTITNDDISPTITVSKTIMSDNGGLITDPDAFGLKVDGVTVMDGIPNPVNVGNHIVSEIGLPGYEPGTWGGDCAANGSVTLALGQNATCTITNDDIAATLTVINVITNDNGGTVTDPDVFGLMVDGGGVNDGATNSFSAGAHTVSQVDQPGYLAGDWGGDCATDGSITLALGQDAICTISNNDISPTLTVVKTITRDNGGTETDPDAFGLRVDGAIVLDSVIYEFDAGNHTVSEDGLAGYDPGDWGTHCAADGSITLALDQDATCTITNDDTDTTSLTLVKQVIKDNGGTAFPSGWILTATDPNGINTGFSGSGPSVSNDPDFSAGIYDLSESSGPVGGGYSASTWFCVGGTQMDGDTISLELGDMATCTITNDDISPTLTVVKTIVSDSGGTIDDENLFGLRVDGNSVLHNTPTPVNAGSHSVSEDGLPGYEAGVWGGDCANDGTVTLALAQNATCSITNNDISPTLTVINTVIHDNGGTVTDPNAFALMVGATAVNDSDTNAFNAGSYTVSQTAVTGYQASIWGGDCAPDGSITLALDQDATCTITNNDISPTITVVKTISNDNGGTVLDPNAFGLRVNGNVVLDGAINTFDAGVSHTVSELGLPFYAAGDWGGDCATDGSITLALAQDATCTITNDDTDETSLTLKKIVVNNNGGGAVASEWTLTATDPNGVLTGFSGSDAGSGVSNGANFSAGIYDLSESGGPGGYAASDWLCTGNGTQMDGDTISLELGDVAECTITNDDITPTLTVLKNIVTDSGGTETNENAFGLKVDAINVLHAVSKVFDAGEHTVTEEGLPGYLAGVWGGDCASDGTVTLALAQNATCSITNNDISPTLTVINTVIHDNGGTVTDPNAFALMVGATAVNDSDTNAFNAGSYTVSQTAVTGYQASIWGGDCAPDGSITLALDQDATCTITNNDISPTITVVKTISNDNGGTVLDPNAFGLRVNGNVVLDGAINTFDAGVPHTVSEVGLPFYAAGDWGGDCATNGSITLALAQDATCTITNDDTDETSLTLVKQVIKDNGGTAFPSGWILTATDPNGINTGFSGSGPSVSNDPNFSAGIYDLSESSGPGGYAASDWVCTGNGTQMDGDTISLELGDVAECTITNDDITPTLTVIKNITNNSGGLVTNPNAFNLRVDGGIVLDSVSNAFDAGSHLVSEDGLPGYNAGSWSGACAANGSVTLALGQNATCTVTNNDISPTITVVNTVINDNGGTVTDPDVFGLMVDTGAVSDSVTNNFDAGTHTVSATGLAGYAASIWGGDCTSDGSVTLALDQDAVCTITHDDISPTITVVKTIVNDNGGTINDPNAFGLKVNGNIVLDGVINTFDAGVSHIVSEDGLPFYAAGDWGGDCATDGSITLALAQDATCTITNDDTDETSLTLRKIVVNNNGGGAVASEWTLTATDPNGVLTGFSGSDAGSGVSNGANFSAGIYDLSESGGPGGYAASDWLCTGNGTQMDGDTISLELGDVAECTITNDDITANLTVLKNIVIDSGGTETNENAFGLKVDAINVLHGVSKVFDAGEHTVTEEGLPGYQAGVWGGDCASDGTVTLALAENATCSITNNDISPTLTVINTVIHDNGGTVTDPNAFALMVGATGVNDSDTNAFDAGSYTVSQTAVTGYQASTWGGDCAPDGSITLALDQDATCTITNNDISPTITVVKTISNDNGGTVLDPNAFGLRVNGNVVLDGAINTFDAGVPHIVSELGLPFYAAGDWGGDCATNGSITLVLAEDATCTITNDDTDETSLTLKKIVVNNNGGGALAEEWTLTATDPNGVLTGFSGSDAGSGVSNGANFSAGIYDLSESGGQGGYAASDWICTGNGTQMDGDTISLELGDVAECTITNDDISPTLTVVKNITNNNGGLVTNPNAFNLRVDGGIVLDSVSNAFDAGSHLVSEDGLPGYNAGSWSGACAANGSVTLALGQNATCTITNNDISPTLTIINVVTSDNGGTVNNPDAFGLMVDGGGVNDSETNAFDAGSHTVSQTGVTGYLATIWGGDCAPDGSITLGLDQDAICTINNDDISPTITVVKTIINDNGGTILDPNAFGLRVDGDFVLDGAGNDFDAGSVHMVSEDGLPFYAAGNWGGDCELDGSIILALAEDATCTITNNDSDSTSLTLVKKVINDNGGSASPSAWTLFAAGPKGFNGNGPSVSNPANFSAGIYNLAESAGPAGYAASAWVCVGGTQLDGDTISLALGDVATCTITNDDITPTLQVSKNIINNNGGTITNRNAFGLRVDGINVLHNVTNVFDAGSHSVSEDGLPGYQAGSWGGDCAPDGSITLALNQHATCSITNNDISPTLTVIKTVINDDGGTVTDPNAFGLLVDGGSVSDSVTNAVDVGDHMVSEVGLAGYQAGSWGGDCAADGSITLELDQDAICTITNDDIPPTLKVFKMVVNDNGGSVTDPNIFGLKVDGNAVQHNVSNSFNAGQHMVSETGLAGYQPGSWGGDCAADGSITLTLGQVATCSITNNDIAPTLQVVKTVVNDNGGTIIDRNSFGLRVDGNTVLHNVTNSFMAGNHVVSEDGLPGYQAGAWSGDCNPDGSITLVLDQVAVCRITNDDIPPTLTVVKTIVNDDGGTINDENVFGLTVDGNAVLHNATNEFDVGSHTVAEDGLTGYEPGDWGGDCTTDGTISLALDQDAICSITNDDITPTLKVVKTIINDNGGTIIDENAFGLKVDGVAVQHNATNNFNAGFRLVSEDGLPGYVPGSWGGDCNPDGSIGLELGQDAVCTITNDDTDSTSLTLVKQVTNDNGGSSSASAWTLTATGPTSFSGAGPNVSNGANFAAGSYDLSESAGPVGYTSGVWTCVGGAQDDADTITLALGGSAICTISSDDISPTLRVRKIVVNDDGGTITNRNAFRLRVDGAVVLHSVVNSFDAGNHTVSEDGLPDYEPGLWGGACNPDGTITLALGQNASCTITNDDINKTALTLVKQVINDDGGTKFASAWTLFATGPSSFFGKGPKVTSDIGIADGTYDLSENGPSGYRDSAWVCVGGTQLDDDTISLALGEAATCTITNDDISREPLIFKDGFE